MTVRQQAEVMHETRQKFINAGVKDVTARQQSYSSAIDERNSGGDVVPILVHDDPIMGTVDDENGNLSEGEIPGKTRVTSGLDRSEVSTSMAPEGQEVAFVSNVAAHEAGHQTLSEMDPHATAASGSVMEAVDSKDADVLGEKPREFDSSDAQQLRNDR